MHENQTDFRCKLHRSGLARVELFVILGVIAALGSMLAVQLRMKYIRELPMRDAAQLQEIHQAMLVFSNDFREWLPRPSLINRHPTWDIHALGAPNPLHDHSGAMYSTMIAQNFFGPELVVSPAEPAEHVRIMGSDGIDYNWDMYDPAADTYWDDSFVMNVADPTIGANASYAHLTLTCHDVKWKWRSTAGADDILLATRGIENGAPPGNPRHDRSPTTRFFKPYNVWAGNVVHGDNSTGEVIRADEHPALVKSTFNRSDNWLSISTSVIETADGHDVVDVYDPLDPK